MYGADAWRASTSTMRVGAEARQVSMASKAKRVSMLVVFMVATGRECGQAGSALR